MNKIEQEYIYNLDIINAQISICEGKISKMLSSYNSEYSAASKYFEEKYNSDPDETYISMGNYHDFKSAYGDSFKIRDGYDEAKLQEYRNELQRLNKMKEQILNEMEELGYNQKTSSKR